jgi:dTMP kinase
LSLFVTFEGTEGSGKTTQIGLLADELRRRGLAVTVTREPGGTALGEQLRALVLESDASISPEAEALLMTAARAEHVRQVIRPALMDGHIVLCDRFYDSTYAYQGAGRGLSEERLRDLQALAVGGTDPDLTLLIDVPVNLGLERRAASKEHNRMDAEHDVFHQRIAAWYQQAAHVEAWRWRVVDGTAPPSVVHTAVLEHVMERIAVFSMSEEHGGVSR